MSRSKSEGEREREREYLSEWALVHGKEIAGGATARGRGGRAAADKAKGGREDKGLKDGWQKQAYGSLRVDCPGPWGSLGGTFSNIVEEGLIILRSTSSNYSKAIVRVQSQSGRTSVGVVGVRCFPLGR